MCLNLHALFRGIKELSFRNKVNPLCNTHFVFSLWYSRYCRTQQSQHFTRQRPYFTFCNEIFFAHFDISLILKLKKRHFLFAMLLTTKRVFAINIRLFRKLFPKQWKLTTFTSCFVIRVDMVGTNHGKVLTQWRHMPMS